MKLHIRPSVMDSLVNLMRVGMRMDKKVILFPARLSGPTSQFLLNGTHEFSELVLGPK